MSRAKGLMRTTLLSEWKSLGLFEFAREYNVSRAPISNDSRDNFLISRILTK